MKEYTYSVARVRARESALLTGQDIETLMASEDYAAAIRVLRDKGYTAEETDNSLTDAAEQSMWEFLSEIADDEILRVLRMPVDYHNLKASVKSVFSDRDGRDLLKIGGNTDGEVIYEGVKNRDYNEFAQRLAAAADEAVTLLLRTQDGQLCDIVIDKAMIDAMCAAARESGDEFLIKYTQMQADFINLRTAFRCARTEKGESFIDHALYRGGSLDIDSMIKAASGGTDSFLDYIENTRYSDFAETIRTSAASFERMCDDKLTELMRTAKYDCFSAAPIIAYVHAKKTELKAVRLILSAKRNRLNDELIRERVRRLYV